MGDHASCDREDDDESLNDMDKDMGLFRGVGGTSVLLGFSPGQRPFGLWGRSGEALSLIFRKGVGPPSVNKDDDDSKTTRGCASSRGGGSAGMDGIGAIMHPTSLRKLETQGARARSGMAGFG